MARTAKIRVYPKLRKIANNEIEAHRKIKPLAKADKNKIADLIDEYNNNDKTDDWFGRQLSKIFAFDWDDWEEIKFEPFCEWFLNHLGHINFTYSRIDSEKGYIYINTDLDFVNRYIKGFFDYQIYNHATDKWESGNKDLYF